MQPIEAYKRGYEQGRKDNLAGNVAQAVMGLLQDDPGGYHAAGYRDGAARRGFSPPPAIERKAAVRNTVESHASDVERQWWLLCDRSDFIVQEIVEYYWDALKARGETAAFVVGLNRFTRFTCPRCLLEGQFKVRFLGRLQHSSCGWQGFMPTGSYIAYQISRIVHSGIRAGGSIKDDSDRKGNRQGGWIDGILVFLLVAIGRALAAAALIPLHAAVALCEPDQPKAARITRATVLAVAAAIAAVVLYKANHARP
jgi:hypothetical protein